MARRRRRSRASPIRTFDPSLPITTRQEFYARVATDRNDQFGNFNGSTNETKAYYVVHYSQFFQDKLTIFGGLRKDKDRNKENYQRRDNVLLRPNGQPRNSPYGTKEFGSPTDWTQRNSPQVGVSYQIKKDLSVYATWSDVLVASNNASGTAYLDQLIRNPDGTYTVGPFVSQPPQTGTNKEVGLKSEFFDGRLSGTLAFFETELTNKVYTVSRDDPSNITLPPGSAPGALAPIAYGTLAGLERRKGVELDVVYNVNKQLRFVASTQCAWTRPSVSRTLMDQACAGARRALSPSSHLLGTFKINGGSGSRPGCAAISRRACGRLRTFAGRSGHPDRQCARSDRAVG